MAVYTQLAIGAISWISAQDVTRAQYIAQADAADQATNRNVLIKLGYTIDKPTPIHCNKNALYT